METSKKTFSFTRRFAVALFFSVVCWAKMALPDSTRATILGEDIALEFDRLMRSRVTAQFNNTKIVLGPMQASEVLLLNGKESREFQLQSQRLTDGGGKLGTARRVTLIGTSGPLQKTETVDYYDSYPSMLFIDVEYSNTGNSDLKVDGWINGRHVLKANLKQTSPTFWSLQNGSYEKRPNWVVPLKALFHQGNYLGMNASDYGGGTPVVDIWRPDVGMAVGHDELSPKLVSFPVDMVARGVQFPNAPSNGFEPIWCAWGVSEETFNHSRFLMPCLQTVLLLPRDLNFPNQAQVCSLENYHLIYTVLLR